MEILPSRTRSPEWLEINGIVKIYDFFEQTCTWKSIRDLIDCRCNVLALLRSGHRYGTMRVECCEYDPTAVWKASLSCHSL